MSYTYAQRLGVVEQKRAKLERQLEDYSGRKKRLLPDKTDEHFTSNRLFFPSDELK